MAEPNFEERGTIQKLESYLVQDSPMRIDAAKEAGMKLELLHNHYDLKITSQRHSMCCTP